MKNKWRNIATKCRRKAIKGYWKKKTEDLKSNPAEFYKTFKPFLNDKGKAVDKSVSLEKDGDVIRDELKVADIFLDHFSSVTNGIGNPELLKQSEEQLKEHPSIQSIVRNKKIVNGPSFEMMKLKSDDVVKALRELDTKKAMGHDRIPNALLKLGSEELAPSLTVIYNKCIEDCYWPREWKKGEWVPVHKKESTHDVKNYRPVTLLSACDKVFEQLLSRQVTAFMEPRLSSNLTAYRKKHSTETTLLNLVEHWKSAIDEGNEVGILSTDMSKAFDSLHPPLLLNKLCAYGFSQSAISLIRSYFTNRKYRVKIGSEIRSEWKEVARGCPQGSTFGPLMWNIFQNDLTYNANNCSLTMYADDHQMYSTGKTTMDIQVSLNREGKNVSDWYESNLLQGNFDKYQAMCMDPLNKEKDTDMKITLSNTCVKRGSEMRLLGVTIDEKLNFGTHISEVCKTAARKVGVLMRLRNMLSTKAKLTIYKSAILPKVTYCHIVWHFCRASDHRKLERIQEKALKAIYNVRNEVTYEQLLNWAKLPTMKNRRLQDIAILMYKVKNELCPSYVQDLFQKNNSRYNLRNSDFVIPRYNTVSYGKHSIKYLGPMLWSKLDKEIRNSNSLNSFKNTIRKKNLEALLEEGCHNCPLCSN